MSLDGHEIHLAYGKERTLRQEQAEECLQLHSNYHRLARWFAHIPPVCRSLESNASSLTSPRLLYVYVLDRLIQR